MHGNTKQKLLSHITIGVDPDDYLRLQSVAKKNGLSTARVVREAMHEFLENETQNAANSESSSSPKHSVVSFFAGCGGLDQGFRGGFDYNGLVFERHPFDFLAAYDSDQKCIDTYKINISSHAEVRDLSNYNPADVPTADVLIGGFPCQDFATCGPRKGLHSDRGKLYLALVRYARHHQPKIIVGENVPGLANIAGGESLKTIVRDVEAEGYRVEVWTLFGPDYGVPQNRTRLFIVCVRNDLSGFPERPEPTHLGEHRTIKWAIQDLKKVRDESIGNQSQYFRASKAKKGNGQGDEVSRADFPAYTVRANAKSRVQFHYSLKRRLTIRECARLQTFPDSFYFPHSATSNLMQIGNAVPPMLGHIVATSISKWLEGK